MVQLITSGMIPSGSQLMENWEASLRSGGLTWINMLKDRALTMPADGGIFAEAYTSAGGRQGSVVTAASSSGLFKTGYIPAKTTGVTEVSAAPTTTASNVASFTLTVSISTPLIFTRLRFNQPASSTISWEIIITKNGSPILQDSFSRAAGTFNRDYTSLDYLSYLQPGDTCTIEVSTSSGVGINTHPTSSYSGTNYAYTTQRASNLADWVIAETVDEPSEATITHTIPAGTFPADMSSSFVTFDSADFEDGASVEYKLKTLNGPFVILEATSISNLSDFQINDCRIKPVSAGKWVLYCVAGSDEVKRAKIYKTLFYGTDGSNPRASSIYITGLTALKTSTSRDVGKQAHYASYQITSSGAVGLRTGTFANTTTNTACSSWSYCLVQSAASDEFGTDTTADELNNPTNCGLRTAWVGPTSWEMPVSTILNTDNGGNVPIVTRALILCVGNITWTGGAGTLVTRNYTTDNSIPIFTLATESIGNDETDFLQTNKVQSFSNLSAEPEELIIKLIPKTTSPTAGYPSLRGVFLQGGKAL